MNRRFSIFSILILFFMCSCNSELSYQNIPVERPEIIEASANPLEKMGQVNPLEKQGQFTLVFELEARQLPELVEPPVNNAGFVDLKDSQFSIKTNEKTVSNGLLKSNQLVIPFEKLSDNTPIVIEIQLKDNTKFEYSLTQFPEDQQTLKVTAKDITITNITNKTTSSQNQNNSCTGENCQNKNSDINIGGNNTGDININQGTQKFKNTTIILSEDIPITLPIQEQVPKATPAPFLKLIPVATPLSTPESQPSLQLQPIIEPVPSTPPIETSVSNNKYFLRLKNVDDHAFVYINGQLKYQAYFGKIGINGESIDNGNQPGDSGLIEMTSEMQTGLNSLLFELKNENGCCKASVDIELFYAQTKIFEDTFLINDSYSGIKYTKEIGINGSDVYNL